MKKAKTTTRPSATKDKGKSSKRCGTGPCQQCAQCRLRSAKAL